MTHARSSRTATRTAAEIDRAVLDASAAVALVADGGPAGGWVAAEVAGAQLLAPALMPFETGNILRRQVAAGSLDPGLATLAHIDLVALPVDLYPYEVLAGRAWELRDSLTIYDAAYVAVAEMFDATLVTLDIKLMRAKVVRCPIIAFTGR